MLLVLLAMVLLLAVMLLLAVVLLARVLVRRRGEITHIGRTTSEVDIDSASVFLSSVLQTHFTADLFNSGLDFLDVVGRVNSLADDTVSRAQALLVTFVLSARRKPNQKGESNNSHMKMVLAMRLGVSNTLF